MSERPLLERMASMTRSLGRVGQMNAAVLMLDASAEIIRLTEALRRTEGRGEPDYAGTLDPLTALEDLLSDMKAGVAHTTGSFERAEAALAKAMETQSAMTEGHGPKDDSAVVADDLPEEPRS